MGKVLGKQTDMTDDANANDGAPVPGSMYAKEDKNHKIKTTYKYGKTHGKLPINRGKVLFLGDARQGKTSLKRRLTGESFNPKQEKTEGIQAKMVETKDIDHRWRSPDNIYESEFERRAAWYTASKTGQERSQETGGREEKSSRAVALDILFFCFLPVVDFVAVFLMINLGYAYSVITLVVFMTLLIDFMTAVRVGTGMAVLIALKVFLFPPVFLKAVSDVLVTYVGPLANLPVLGLGFAAFWFLFGFSMAVGFRPMMSVVFCLMSSPTQVSLDLEMVTLITVGVSTGIITYQCWGFFARRLPTYLRFSGRTWLSLFLVIISLSNFDCISEPALMLYCGFCAALGACLGLETGRAAMVPVRHLNLFTCAMVSCGLLSSLGYSYAFGWQLPTIENISCVAVLTAMALLLIECYRFHRYDFGIPITLIEKAMREKERGAQSFPTNLTLMDFAGDEEYYNMHHIFLAHEAVYLLVFSMAEAVRNQHRTLDRLLFWLHSVKTHATSEECAVFLVGTHRDSVTDAQRREMAKFLLEHLYSATDFSSMLVLNANNTLLFLVENSKQVDEDMICLRDAIWTMTQQVNDIQRQLPIKWLKFLEVVKRIGRPIISVSDLRQECSQIGVESEEEFREVLRTFDQAGDIIYQANDDTLKHYVVLDPQLLVDAMAKITCPHPTHLGIPKFVEDLNLLEKKGIVSIDFIHNAVAQLNTDQPEVLLKLLVAYDMLCPLEDGTHSKTGHTTYLVPSKLPDYNPKLHRRLSERHDDDQVFYIDFKTFKPDVVYTRVVARCLALCDVEERTHTRTHVFRNVGCFNMANCFCFTIEAMRPAPDQNVLKVTVTSATGNNPFDLLGVLHDMLEAIRCRDFPNMSYTSGVRCPFEAPHSDYTEQERIHVLKLAGSGETYQNEYHPLTFLCCGREHQVVRSRTGTSVLRHGAYSAAMSHKSCHPTQLDFSHIQKLSLLLDPPQVLGNDWKGLADHLDYDVTEILNFQRKESPTTALLVDYSTKVDKTEAVRKITESLEVLGRLDAVAVISSTTNRSLSHGQGEDMSGHT